MAKTQILDYYIHLTDKDRADALNAQVVAGGGPDVGELLFNPQTNSFAVLRAPDGAKVEFAEPPVNPLPLLGGADPFVSPSIKSDWFGKGFQTNVAVFQRSTGWWIFGHDTRFYWAGHFVYSPTPGSGDAAGASPDDGIVNEAAPIPVRVFLDGFEQNGNAEGGTQTNGHTARCASRTVDGFGFPFRHAAGTASNKIHDYVPTRSRNWERFYFRISRAGSIACEIWQGKHLGTNPGGIFLYVVPGGGLAVYANNSSGNTLQGTVVGAGSLTVGTWYEIDVMTHWFVPSANVHVCELRVWINKVFKGNFGFVPGGIDVNVTQSASMLGKTVQTDICDAEIDFDDWRCGDIPNDKEFPPISGWLDSQTYNLGDTVVRGTWADVPNTPRSLVGLPQWFISKTGGNLNHDPLIAPGAGTHFWHRLIDSPDFLVGSHIQTINGTSFGTGHGAWGAAVVQQFWPRLTSSGTPDVPTSSVALDPIVLNMDVASLNRTPGAIGMGAIGVNATTQRGTGSGTLGYKINAAAFVDVALTEAASLTSNAVFFLPPSAADILPMPTALAMRYVKGNDVGAARVKAMHMMVELLGTFGPEDISDDPTFDDTPRPEAVAGYHNAGYQFSPWARTRQGALGPVVVKSGTYVGNGTARELLFEAPVHFLFIRSQTAGQQPTLYIPTEIGPGHPAGQQGTGGEFVNRMDLDPTFVAANPTTDDQQTSCRVTIVGTDTRWNANAVTYQYLAIMDPARRFLLAGAAHHGNIALPATDAIEDAEFLPEIGFFQKGEITTTTTANLWWKALGHAVTGAQIIATGTAEAASAISFFLGQLRYDTGYITASIFDQISSYALFRRGDGNNDPGQTALYQMGSYVGDGGASRTISLATSGKRPLWALFVPTSATAGAFRDPAHTGTNSSNVSSGANVTTSIVGGGIDTISLGSALNTNGVTFNYFVVMGSATAGNAGWSIDGTFIPVASDSPNPPSWEEPVVIPAIVPPTPTLPGEPDLDSTTTVGTVGGNIGGLDGGQVCEVYTRALVNIALSRIGVSKVIGNLATDQTEIAVTARKHVKEDINAVLRDFPWSWATRYETLVLVGGSATVPVNNDWQYSYRAPNAMMFGRRIAVAGVGRKSSLQVQTQPWMSSFPSINAAPPIPFRVSQDDTGLLIYCNESTSSAVPLVLEYTVRLACPAFFGDARFREALTWKFAASLAPALSRDPKRGEFCLQVYTALLAGTEVDNANEQQQEPDPDAPWISGR